MEYVIIKERLAEEIKNCGLSRSQIAEKVGVIAGKQNMHHN